MKKTFLFVLVLMLAVAAFSQNKIPAIDIKTTGGETFNTASIQNDGKPILISFWALWCKPCIRELNTINELYSDWQDETGVKLYAISIDDARSSSKVLPYANGNDWDYEILLDPNGDFKRAMNVNMIPHMFLIDGNGDIVWQHTSFAEGGEYEIIKLLHKVAKGEDISNLH